MNTTTHNNPTWWDTEHDTAWDRVRAAFKRDWEQTKHEMGGNEPDLHQNIANTVRQATGDEPIPGRHQRRFEDIESAYRFGYGAHRHYSNDYPEWDDELEARLREEWGELEPSRRTAWEEDREAIQHAWDYWEAE